MLEQFSPQHSDIDYFQNDEQYYRQYYQGELVKRTMKQVLNKQMVPRAYRDMQSQQTDNLFYNKNLNENKLKKLLSTQNHQKKQQILNIEINTMSNNMSGSRSYKSLIGDHKQQTMSTFTDRSSRKGHFQSLNVNYMDSKRRTATDESSSMDSINSSNRNNRKRSVEIHNSFQDKPKLFTRQVRSQTRRRNCQSQDNLDEQKRIISLPKDKNQQYPLGCSKQNLFQEKEKCIPNIKTHLKLNSEQINRLIEQKLESARVEKIEAARVEKIESARVEKIESSRVEKLKIMTQNTNLQNSASLERPTSSRQSSRTRSQLKIISEEAFSPLELNEKDKLLVCQQYQNTTQNQQKKLNLFTNNDTRSQSLERALQSQQIDHSKISQKNQKHLPKNGKQKFMVYNRKNLFEQNLEAKLNLIASPKNKMVDQNSIRNF